MEELGLDLRVGMCGLAASRRCSFAYCFTLNSQGRESSAVPLVYYLWPTVTFANFRPLHGPLYL